MPDVRPKIDKPEVTDLPGLMRAEATAELARQLGVEAVPSAVADAWLRPATDRELDQAYRYTRALTGRTRNHWHDEDWAHWARALSVIKFLHGVDYDSRRGWLIPELEKIAPALRRVIAEAMRDAVVASVKVPDE